MSGGPLRWGLSIRPPSTRALADHLRSLGFTVGELPRPTLITARLLGGYDLVIRAAGVWQAVPQPLTKNTIDWLTEA